jgi:hypothetical protein
LRLFAAACCRRRWHLFSDERLRTAVEAAERLADGRVTPAQWEAAEAGARAAGSGYAFQEPPGWDVAMSATIAVSRAASHGDTIALAANAADTMVHVEQVGGGQDAVATAAQTELLRDIFGNPFRPVSFDPAWRTSTVVALAGQMYESRDFGAMPILADALQDAGCGSDDILDHCRDPKATHVRGCWVVDFVLGKQ